MRNLPELSPKQREVLRIIASDPHVIIFDLEAAELTRMGLISEHNGRFRLTELGRTMLASCESREDSG